MTSTAWFHEDDFCMIELLPLSARPFVERQVREADAFASAHEAPGGGWTDVYLFREPPDDLETLSIGLPDVAACIPAGLERFDQVTTGYGAHTESAPDATAWGRAGSPLVFAHVGTKGVVRHLWLASFGVGEAADAGAFLTECGRKWPLILVDRWWSQVMALGNGLEVSRYLSLRAAPRDE